VKKYWVLEIGYRRNGCLKIQGKRLKTKKAKNLLNQCRTHQQKAKAQAEYTEIDKRVKKSVRKDKRPWVDDLAQKAEEAQKK
jgi:hypothetical protein